MIPTQRGPDRDLALFLWGVIALIAIVTTIFLLLAPSGQAYSTNRFLNETATWLAQRPVTVKCQEEGEYDQVIDGWGASGYVEDSDPDTPLWTPADFTVIEYRSCQALVALSRGDASGVSVPDLAWAVLVITHESGHLRGWRWSSSESKTQAWALRHFVPVAVHFGLSEPAARFLLRFAVKWHMGMPPEYRGPHCAKPTVNADGYLEGCSA